MTFQIKVVVDQSFDKCLFQFSKGYSNSRYEKAQFRLLDLDEFWI